MKVMKQVGYIALIITMLSCVPVWAQDKQSLAEHHKQQAQTMAQEQSEQERAEDAKPHKVSPKKERNSVRSGNKLYNKEKFVDSEVEYRRAVDANPESAIATYNLGNSLYRQEKYEEAGKSFEQALHMTDDKELQAKALHNMGNVMMQQQQ